MRPLKYFVSVSILNVMLAMSGSVSANAETTSATTAPTPRKSEYFFKQNETPVMLPVIGRTAVLPVGGTKIYTLRGAEIADVKDPILDVKVSPTGTTYVIVSLNKKFRDACVGVSDEFNSFRYKHNPKKNGSPSSAVYTPDGRMLVLATDKGIAMHELRKYQPIDSFPMPFVPTVMEMSSNGYYLAMTDGHRLAVYNFADKRLRKDWTFDARINDMKFSPDNSEFSVLDEDGLLSIYDTRTFIVKKNIDGLGDGIAFDYNPDGKYVAVMTAPTAISMVNLLKDDEREIFDVEGDGSDVVLLLDSESTPLLTFSTTKGVNAKRLTALTPYYGKLITDRADEMMEEWLKMMPGETMEQYRARVNDESRKKQRRMFEDEIATSLAGDLVSMANISLGKYDRTNQMLAVAFDNMPSIFLPVPESSVGAFSNPKDITITDAKYGIMPDDNFELIYAKFHNGANGETYIYDNIDRVPLNFMEDDNMVSIEVLQQQQMEELRLQELRERVVNEAKSRNVISDHTNITVDSRVVPDYDADGNKILNYIVKFSYEVEPEYSIHEDFPPGKYNVSESGAASSMLSIVKQAMEGDLAQYINSGKKLQVKISGAADGTPIHRIIPYDGSYGDFEEEPIYQDDKMTVVTVTKKGGITQNEQLAFLRGYGVKDFLEKNVENLRDMNTDYQYHISVSKDKGSEFRRIVAEFKFVDAF